MHDTEVTVTPLARAWGLIQLLRPKQWIKNGFVLAPLLFAGEFMRLSSVWAALTAAVLFCIASSATYIINDWHDIERDRKHPVKAKKRPLASGVVTRPLALSLLLFLYLLLALTWSFAADVVLVLIGYMVLNLAYTYVLKHQPVIDIFTIAVGFVLRVYAGAVALAVPLSSWMFVTTLSIALYLAAVKRRQELNNSGSEARRVLERYSPSLVDRYAEMAGTMTLVFYSLFVMASRPALVATVPLVLFGLFRYWYVVEQHDEGESPTDAVLEDWQLLVTLALWIGVCIWAMLPTGSV